MTTEKELLKYINVRIEKLTEIREEMLSQGDASTDRYTEGAIDALHGMRIKLEGKVEIL